MSIQNKIVVVLILLLLGGSVVFIGLSFQAKNEQKTTLSLNQQVQKKYEQKTVDEDFLSTGKIFLSLEKSNKKEGDKLGIYSYDIKNDTLEEFLVDKNTNKNQEFYTNQLSPDGEQMVFASSVEDESQIYIADKNGENKKQITTSTEKLLKRCPKWSYSQDLIAFQTLPLENKALDAFLVKNWEVFVTDLNGNEKFITKGASPIFLSDGRLLVMKENGLYIFDIENSDNKGFAIWFFGINEMTSNMKLAVSDNGKYLALTDSFSVSIFEIEDWKSLSMLGEARTIDVSGYWPVFSPDSNFMILQKVNKETEKNPKLFMYNLQTLEKKELLDLGDYNRLHMFVSDWVE